MIKIKRALISVSDKTNLVELGEFLITHGVEIISTGGSAKTLRDAGVTVTDVSDVTGFPEIMHGRVKTLHPKIHGGILARRDDKTHLAAMQEHDITGIDLVVLNLYPFEKTIASNAGEKDCVENIDIGGPAMLRAAAKNFDFVTVITDPSDYPALKAELMVNKGSISLDTRKIFAAKAFGRTAQYDAMIAQWMTTQKETFPHRWNVGGACKQILRYGENPHQKAALYVTGNPRPGVANATQLQGKELSYNNINDTNAAFELVAEFDEPTVAIIKHANPCGVASAENIAIAYERALSCDSTSAFGGIIATNREIDAAAAQKMIEIFTEVIIAPAIASDAQEIFASKKNLRVLITGAMPDRHQPESEIKTIAGGLLVQDKDIGEVKKDDLKCVTKKQPTEQEMADMLFAFKVCKHVKSNAIIYVRNLMTVGIGAGQMSRVDSAQVAVRKAKEAQVKAGDKTPWTDGAVVASDAFFPFADGLLTAASAGVTAVIQPGGSIRDDEVIAAADEKHLSMVFTGMRHFKH